jgi:hypothetical protein
MHTSVPENITRLKKVSGAGIVNYLDWSRILHYCAIKETEVQLCARDIGPSHCIAQAMTLCSKYSCPLQSIDFGTKAILMGWNGIRR